MPPSIRVLTTVIERAEESSQLLDHWQCLGLGTGLGQRHLAEQRLLHVQCHVANDAHVRFQLLDSDLAFLHQGSTEQWCAPP